MEDLNYFIREVEFGQSCLQIYQAYVADEGHVVWDAALVLSKFLETSYFKKNFPLNDRKVVELGAGTAIVSLCAAMLGANTYATDLLQLVPLMQKNIDENKLVKGSITALPLKWGDEGGILNLHEVDYILVADCVYYEESLNPLIHTMKSMCGSETKIFLSYEHRDTEHKIEILGKFLQLVNEYFDIEEIPQHVQDEEYRSPDIHILKMKMKKQ